MSYIQTHVPLTPEQERRVRWLRRISIIILMLMVLALIIMGLAGYFSLSLWNPSTVAEFVTGFILFISMLTFGVFIVMSGELSDDKWVREKLAAGITYIEQTSNLSLGFLGILFIIPSLVLIGRYLYLVFT